MRSGAIVVIGVNPKQMPKVALARSHNMVNSDRPPNGLLVVRRCHYSSKNREAPTLVDDDGPASFNRETNTGEIDPIARQLLQPGPIVCR